MSKSGRLELGENIYGHYRSVFNQSELASEEIEFGEKRKIRAITPFKSFKVIEVGINRKPVCNFPLVIKYRFGVNAAYCSNCGYFAF